MATIKKSALVAAEAGSDAVELLLAFPLADQWFALPAQNVVAVVEADRLHALADDPADLVGSVQFHGSEVLVRDMTALLVPGASAGPAEQIILVRGLAAWAGLTTPGTAEMVTMPVAKLDLDHTSPLSTGSWRTAQRTITMLDPELLVSSVRPLCQN